MDNGAASNELFQLLLPTHNQSVKNNDKIEGETLKKLIHRNFRSKTLVPVKTDYEAAKIKVVDAISNIAIKLNTQTDITELVLNNTEKLSRRPSDSTSNTGEKFPTKKNHAVQNHNSHSRNSHDSQQISLISSMFGFYFTLVKMSSRN
ncbi:hypothetical protein ACTFIR_003824 [Dictyostelium discoideum]